MTLTYRKIITSVIAFTIFIVSVIYIGNTFNWQEIFDILATSHVWLIAFAGTGTIILFFFIRALRWYLLLDCLGIHVSFRELYLCTAVSLSVSIITPLQSGEALKVELLKQYRQVERPAGYSTFLFERCMDLLIIVMLAVANLPFIFNNRFTRFDSFCLLLIIILLFFLIILLTGRLSTSSKAGLIAGFIQSIFAQKIRFCSILLLTLFGWLIVAVGWQACLYGISIELDILESIGLMSIVTLINILSFIPGAVGISEAGISELLIVMGNTPSAAQAGAMILRVYSLLVLMVGGLHLLIWTVFSPMPGLLKKQKPS